MDVNQTRKKNGSKATEPNIEQFDYHYTIQSPVKINVTGNSKKDIDVHQN